MDCYELTKFLSMHRSETLKNPATKEDDRIYDMKDPDIPNNFVPHAPLPEEQHIPD